MSQSELLTAHFDEAFSAPDGLKRLRELILTLAMQGKLVEQDPTEGTADDLLRDIEVEKQRLVAEGKIKTPKLLPAIELEEVPFKLPEGWRWVRLGHFLEMINGRAFKPHEWRTEGLPIVRIQNLNNRAAPFNHCDENIVTPKNIIEFGEFLISWSGTPGTSFGAFIWHGGRAALNQHIFKCIQVGRPYYDHFLLCAINSRIDYLIDQAQGAVGLKHVTKGTLELMLLPLPPLPEQRRIVDRIDQLMARCDELEALRAQQEQMRVRAHTAILREIMVDADPTAFQQNWQFLADHFGELHATPQNVAELRSAVLQLAVIGKLVPQDPTEGSAADLIAGLKTRGKASQGGHVDSKNGTGFRFSLPQSWRIEALENLLAFGPSNGYSPKAVDFPTKTKSLTLSSTTSGRFKSEHYKYIDEIIPDNSDLWLREGDILVQRGNTLDYVGVSAIYSGSANEFIYPDLMMKIRLLNGIDNRYVHYVMSSKSSRDYMRERATGTSGTMPKINQATLKSLPIPLPPLAEQRRIVVKVDQLMRLCDLLESRLNERTAKQGELLRAVMAELAPTLPPTRPAATSRARLQAPAGGAEAPRGRGRPRKVVEEGTEAVAQLTSERRGRGRPRKDASIPTADSVEDAIRRLEGLKAERARSKGPVGLFEEA